MKYKDTDRDNSRLQTLRELLIRFSTNGIPYVINSNCSAISDTNTSDGAYCLAYGSLTNYEVPIFSGVEIGKSTDYKFKDGIICYKASVFTGGNVVGFNGFLRIKKGTEPATTND